ncbi:hypothetical protein BO71DRAFT_397000, partial [Aspergillus ellipticus CBS 707.79]
MSLFILREKKMALIPAQDTEQLQRALRNASKDTLESILVALCNQVPFARGYMAGKLLIKEDEIAPADVADESDSDNSDESGESDKSDDSGSKRKRKRMAQRMTLTPRKSDYATLSLDRYNFLL